MLKLRLFRFSREILGSFSSLMCCSQFLNDLELFQDSWYFSCLFIFCVPDTVFSDVFQLFFVFSVHGISFLDECFDVVVL